MVYKESSWDLFAIAPQNFNQALEEIERKTTQLEAKRSLLTATIIPGQFLSLVKELEQLRIITAKISGYVNLKFSEDSANQVAVAQMSKVENILTKIGNRLIFFGLWFKDLPEKKAQELIKASGPYRYHFEQLRKTKPYTLKENEEKIINIKDLSGISALNTIYNILTSQFKYEWDGKEITQEELLVLARDHSPQVREKAYRTLLTKYKEYHDVIGEIYKNLVNDWREENIDLRGYKNPINVRNVVNDIPDKAIEALIHVCERNQPLFHRFFEIKRKRLGLKKMRRFDLYAPVEEKSAKTSYDDGVKMVLQTFGEFSEKFKEGALQIVEAQQVHSKVQKNKQTGAFCYSITAKMPPYILLNYTGTLRDVSTIAHELGHGIHHQLAAGQTEFTNQSCLPLAETASILSEMILSDALQKKDPVRATELLFFKLDDIYASIIRQIGFVSFEQKAHEMMKEGKTLQEMGEVYLADLRKQLGPMVEVDEIYAYEWSYIPHIFHTPFYCYAYAFGNLLTLALFEMYKEQGAKFVPKIIEMLAKGGSESPIDITHAVGIDICSEEFWQKGFDVIEKMIDEIE